ncbi:OmpH family outer membrane protein [Francisella sp. 19X1-34]|uniref:OmpH family outer membrane protein n=1 Tax=Francisella sp. 19X1-34 TaxID=3087177 RepID=UPI002E345195|nr:OmpH family outer membrane protein [Francisella sp. 19X1-34]MED7789697.1 OmpH family outer membrane protein [Francisella sp. 19X1-34]
MKISKAIVSTILISSTLSCFANSIGIVNVDKVFKSSKIGQVKLSKDQDQFKPKLEVIRKETKLLETKLKAKHNTKQEKLIKENLKSSISKYEQLLTQVRNVSIKDYKSFKQELKQNVKQVSQSQHLDVVLPSELSLYNSNSVDITKEIINKMK